MIIFVAVIDINIEAKTGSDLNHFVRNIFKSDFIMFYTITDELTWNAPASSNNAGRFQRTKTFKAVDLYIAAVISSWWRWFLVKRRPESLMY